MADKIPTVAEVLAAVADGTVTPEDAEVLIGQHITTAVDTALAACILRDEFASRAMQTLMADKGVAREAANAAKDPTKAVAKAAFDMASAMVEESKARNR